MTARVCIVLCFAAMSMTMAAQTLVSTTIPIYPPLARQARIGGIVKLTFTLPANSGEPTNVEADSGHPGFTSAA
jgi:outer membrane biosynthesis protein TonB